MINSFTWNNNGNKHNTMQNTKQRKKWYSIVNQKKGFFLAFKAANFFITLVNQAFLIVHVEYSKV